MDSPKPEDAVAAPGDPRDAGEQLAGGTYEIIRNRLATQGQDLRGRLDKLNKARKEVFGAIDTKLLTTARIATENNCMPRDMVPLGSKFLFAYNVHLGLRTTMELKDVFAVYEYHDHQFTPGDLSLISDPRFESDFHELFKYYKDTEFWKFSVIGPSLYMVFRVGKVASDVKVFKWLMHEDGSLTYVDNRSAHEYRFPPQHEFEWTRTHMDMKRAGLHPHVSIEDRIFVETVGGDLTIKVEDATDVGTGVYSEPVEQAEQTLDDAEFFYATVGNLILLKIRPYQEEDYRYIVYSEKVQQAKRIDQVKNSCVMLPEGYGIIFSNGFYLQTGDYKEFETGQQEMLFEKRIQAPNGEDYLYVFFSRQSGDYALLSYNMIDQRVEPPIICHGYCLFPNGELLYFRRETDPRKSHAIQIWQTPFVGPEHHASTQSDSHLYKIGNKDIVRCMASCGHILGLIGREDSYANLYIDIVRQTTEVIDANFWLNHTETFHLDEPLGAIRVAAEGAIEEFEKVVRMRKATRDRIAQVSKKTEEILNTLMSSRFETIDEFVKVLADLRAIRGSIIQLRELRYTDLERVDAMESEVEKQTASLSTRCVEFLLGENALEPYRLQVVEMKDSIDELQKVSEAKKVEEAIAACGGELELLIDIVSNLKIDDATQRTRIIDSISDIYSTLNQVRAALKRRMGELSSVEGAAEFASQMKLINQAVINYLDVCDTPEKCDEYLSKIMIQLEELEGKFAELEDFIDQITEKREEAYTAFESRKVALVETRNRRADGLVRSAERVLKGIRTRVEGFESVEQINGYFAADLMIDKVRDVVETLLELDDTVRADDIRSRLKTIREDAVRQLTDRKELYSGDGSVIKMGDHHFSVNTQPLDLTTVQREADLFLHLTGTRFFEEIKDEGLLATRPVWDQQVISEDESVYRAEYLAYMIFKALSARGADPSLETAGGWSEDERKEYVRKFMGPRYAEGYAKGVHDHDAAVILGALVELHAGIGLLRYHTRARAMAGAFWHRNGEAEKVTQARVQGFGQVVDLFDAHTIQDHYVRDLRERLEAFAEGDRMFDRGLAAEAGEYLFHVLRGDGQHPVSREASDLHRRFTGYLKHHGAEVRYRKSLEKLQEEPAATFGLICDWVDAFIKTEGKAEDADYRDEAAGLLVTGKFDPARIAAGSIRTDLSGLSGNHPVLLEGGTYRLHYNDFMHKLARFESETVPAFKHFQKLKHELVDKAREEMRLEEFRPQVLTSFVRNRLIDKVYLPLVGANLAKQVGTAGDDKRTDRMGMLLLISPPGYGKTTLMEYIANRLGIIFMKINGPAIGHQVTSIDPGEAPNATAREELSKLNLALEMGDNVMIYLDDIQHCNPELLQKFISLCDAQRKIEGVYKGRARTYDLRGRKVAVIMAGNPYTESGEAFQVPDMLANRADTYNLGNIIGDNGDAFKLSYLENALTSNPSLNRLISKNRKDIHGIIRIAESGTREGVDLAGSYSGDELEEAVNVMKKLLRVRDVILTVNQEYIRSAAQADAYRTEPPFKLQGSYRNMGRIAERVLPVMNDEELETLIASDYENEAQTLTTGAESNLLKFKELAGVLAPEETQRWEDIKKTFQKRQQMMGVESSDRMGQVLVQLGSFGEGLESIRNAVTAGVESLRSDSDAKGDDKAAAEIMLAEDSLSRLEKLLGNLVTELRPEDAPKKKSAVVETRLSDDTLKSMAGMLASLPRGAAPAAAAGKGGASPSPVVPNIQIVSKLPRGLLQSIQEQLKLFQKWLDPLLSETNKNSLQIKGLRESLDGVVRSFKGAMAQLEATRVEDAKPDVEGGTR